MSGPTGEVVSRADCEALDAADPLAPLRNQFDLPDDVIYLDGNSLGALPRAAASRLHEVIAQEWGRGLIRSWNDAGWVDLPHRLGDKLAPLIGAGPGEVVIADSTSVNLFKTLWAALSCSPADSSAPGARAGTVVADAASFPTDLYIAESVAKAFGVALELVAAEDLSQHLSVHRGTRAVLMNHVDYRTGAQLDLPGITALAHAAGAVMVWDLAHSAGAVPLDLSAAGADFAVGCGYKYLNGGPGAPAFVWVHPRHHDTAVQPLSGWFAHAAPFAFEQSYRPVDGVRRFLCGTPAVLSMAALETGLDTLLAAEPYGGMAALSAKSVALTELFADLVATRCPQLRLTTPPGPRGSHLAFSHPEGAYPIVQAAIAHGVIGDFRAPDLLRYAVTPLYTRYVDVWDAAATLEQVLRSGEWREERFAVRAAVT